MNEKFITATGYAAAYLPPGERLDGILVAIRLGQQFSKQHCGRKPGFLHHYICGIVSGMEKPTFENLLAELDLAAARRDVGDDSSPIERVSRSWEMLTYHDPKKGEKRVTFGAIKNILTKAKHR